MARRSGRQKSGTTSNRQSTRVRSENDPGEVPQHAAVHFRVSVNTAGNAFIDFTDQVGRIVRVRFPSAELPILVDYFREAAAAAALPHEAVQLPSTTVSNIQDGVRLNVQRPKQLVPSPHGAFEFGTSVDLSRVLITIHMPNGMAIDHLIDFQYAKQILSALAKVITLVETEHSEKPQ